jgi:D-glycero-D-manno-heptose 1,7-bisphosphate phosphatase
VVREAGAMWGGFYACPHLPEGVNQYAVVCDCRKPAAGLIREASERLGVAPEDGWFIGDTWMDMAAGRAVGCRTILVGSEWRDGSSYPSTARPHHAVPDLAAAAAITIADHAVTDHAVTDHGPDRRQVVPARRSNSA